MLFSSEIGLTPEQLHASLGHIKPVKSRYNAETYLGKTLITQLAKGQNPIACSRGFQYVGQAAGQKALILTLDDKYDAAHSSENPAWLFETDYSPLTSDSITQIIVGGKRRYRSISAAFDGRRARGSDLSDRARNRHLPAG